MPLTTIRLVIPPDFPIHLNPPEYHRPKKANCLWRFDRHTQTRPQITNQSTDFVSRSRLDPTWLSLIQKSERTPCKPLDHVLDPHGFPGLGKHVRRYPRVQIKPALLTYPHMWDRSHTPQPRHARRNKLLLLCRCYSPNNHTWLLS